jgi:predicted DNA-binding transcriptional regulator AlpA
MTTTVMVPKLMTSAEVCAAVGCCYPTLMKMVREGGFPEPVPFKRGHGRKLFWRAEDVRRKLEER